MTTRSLSTFLFFPLPLFPVLLLLLSAPLTHAGEDWQALFNGQDLTHWEVEGGGEWKVVDGVLQGSAKQVKGRPFLVSEREYGDFIARVVYRSISGNSGFFFRSTLTDRGMDGLQAEIEPGARFVGGLYESGSDGRKWVVKPEQDFVKQFFKPGEWNEMFVIANGGDITVLVNGAVVADVSDDPGAAKGHFGLQLHKGAREMEVHFKTIEIIEDPSEEQINRILKENTK